MSLGTIPQLNFVVFPTQTFDVVLLAVTSGGGSLGPDNTVRVGILKNDSPTGLFSFVILQVKYYSGTLSNIVDLHSQVDKWESCFQKSIAH